MIISILNRLFSEDIVGQKGRTENVMPGEIMKKDDILIKKIIPPQFQNDVNALETYLGGELKTGLCINVTLAELLAITPRKRRRIDAYNSLVKYLKDELGVELTITSKKTKL